MEVSGEAIPFIEIIDYKDNNHAQTRFEVNSQAISLLASLKKRQVFLKKLSLKLKIKRLL